MHDRDSTYYISSVCYFIVCGTNIGNCTSAISVIVTPMAYSEVGSGIVSNHICEIVLSVLGALTHLSLMTLFVVV